MTGLDHLSALIARELRRVSAMIFEAYAESPKGRTSDRYRAGRIVMLVLHRNHARCEATAAAPGEAFHLLAIVNHPKLARRRDVWRLVHDRLDRAWQHGEITHPVRLTIESLEGINRALCDGVPHFTTIAPRGSFSSKRRGCGFKRRARCRRQTVARESSHNMRGGTNVRAPSCWALLSIGAQGNAPMAALLLHQTCEHLYQCALRSLILHGPRTHAIDELREVAEALEPGLRATWPREDAPERHAFRCIRRAYVEVRYGRSYRISTDELAWAMDRTAMLHDLVAKLCPDRLSMSAAPPEACHVL